jgi:chromosome segregation ATPase
MLGLLTFLKLVPLRDWLYIAVGLALTIGLLAYNSHERSIGRAQSEAKIVDLQHQLDAAQQANATFDSTVAALKQAVADCEKNRRVEAAQAVEAKSAWQAQIDTLKALDAKQHVTTQQRLATSCKDIASAPSCVTAAP